MRRGMIGLILVLCFLPACAVAGAAQMQNYVQDRETAIYEGPLAVVPPQAERDLTRRASVVTRSSDTAPLYAQPNAQSVALMTYYSGAPVEVIRSVGGFFLVQTGGAQAGLMGYMRAEDLASVMRRGGRCSRALCAWSSTGKRRCTLTAMRVRSRSACARWARPIMP